MVYQIKENVEVEDYHNEVPGGQRMRSTKIAKLFIETSEKNLTQINKIQKMSKIFL